MNKRLAPAPLSASVRQSDDDYPGVIASLPGGWRMAVSMCGGRYVLQQRADTPDGPRWVPAGGRCPGKLDRIAAKYSADVEGLAALCAALPEDPAEVAGDLPARWSALQSALSLRDVSRPEYPRLAAQAGNLRIVVCPEAVSYLLQWVKVRDAASPQSWVPLKRFRRLSDLRSYMLKHVGLCVAAGDDGVLRGDQIAASVDAMLSGLPESPLSGCWPDVPALPGG